jgi:hypothetical protein
MSYRSGCLQYFLHERHQANIETAATFLLIVVDNNARERKKFNKIQQKKYEKSLDEITGKQNVNRVIKIIPLQLIKSATWLVYTQNGGEKIKFLSLISGCVVMFTH